MHSSDNYVPRHEAKTGMSPNGAKYPILRRGDMVVATDDFDPLGANVRRGMLGVCFEEANAYGDGGGPMVKWTLAGTCNVYSDMCAKVERLIKQGGIVQVKTDEGKILRVLTS